MNGMHLVHSKPGEGAPRGTSGSGGRVHATQPLPPEGGLRSSWSGTTGRAESFLTRLRRRKLCRWTLSYVAIAWISLQLLDVLGEIWDISVLVQQMVSLTLGLGLLPTVVLAWYHGERGRQHVCRSEVVVLTAVLVGSAALLHWFLRHVGA